VASYDGNRISRLSGEEDSSAPSEGRMRKNGIDRGGVCAGVINTSSGTLEQFTDYYPYGMPHTDAIGADKNRRKFVSKELTTEYGIDLYDFEQRYLSLDIPCFMSPDRLAYETPHITPYSYCHGDPINYIDPTGLFKTFSETLFYTSFYIGAKVLWDYERSEWFLSLNETGSAAYKNGDTVTKFFGPSSGGGRGGYHAANTMVRMRRVGAVVSAFSAANGLKEHLIVWSVRTGPLKGVPGAKMLSDIEAVTIGMGKDIGNYFKVVVKAGQVAAIATAVTTAFSLADYYLRGDGNKLVYIKGALDVSMAIVGCAGFPGYLISTAYYVADMNGLVWKALRYCF
ncbi:MAG: hypothetical protein K2F94_00045, partial [Muribaculaceae bacterium]|nr:hypothetical protein [Muribaculaceae bacterium]